MARQRVLVNELLMDSHQNVILLFQLLLYYSNMEKNTATTIFESLSSGLRLDVYRLLVRKGTEGMVAGEISTLSSEFAKMGDRLQSLEKAASEFSRRVA